MLPVVKRLALLVTCSLAGAPASGCAGQPVVAPTAAGTVAHGMLEAAVDLDGRPVGPLPVGGRATVAVVFASWCGHCRAELPVLATLAERWPDVRVLGVNYRGHEEYEQRGDAAAVRAFVAELAPWLRVVPADERLWSALGRPAKVPTVYVFDRGGRLVHTFDRRSAEVPTLADLEAALPR